MRAGSRTAPPMASPPKRMDKSVNRVAPKQIKMLVRSPAGLPLASRSQPIAPPRTTASISRTKRSGRRARPYPLLIHVPSHSIIVCTTRPYRTPKWSSPDPVTAPSVMPSHGVATELLIGRSTKVAREPICCCGARPSVRGGNSDWKNLGQRGVGAWLLI